MGADDDEAGGFGAADDEAGGFGADDDGAGGFGAAVLLLGFTGTDTDFVAEDFPPGLDVTTTVWPTLFRLVTTVTFSPAELVVVDVSGGESCGSTLSVGTTTAVDAGTFVAAFGLAPISPCGGPEMASAGPPTSNAAATPPMTGRRR